MVLKERIELYNAHKKSGGILVFSYQFINIYLPKSIFIFK